VVYLAGALLITLTAVLTGGTASYLSSREFYAMLAVAVLVALVGVFLIARTAYAARTRRRRILRLRNVIRQRRQELSRR
jgi:hypothetical protein